MRGIAIIALAVFGFIGYEIYTMPELVGSSAPKISYINKKYTDSEPGICIKAGPSMSIGFSEDAGWAGVAPAMHPDCPVDAYGKFMRKTWVNTYSDGSKKTVSFDTLIERIR